MWLNVLSLAKILLYRCFVVVILLQGTFLSFFGNLRIICDFVAHGDHSSNIDARGNSTEHCLDSFDLWLFCLP